jgi:predicted PurR-regulated permease PerM
MPVPTKTPPFLLVLVAATALLVILVLAPFAGALFAAAVVAGMLFPLQTRLRSALRRPGLAAAVLTMGFVLVVLVPLSILLIFAAQHVPPLADDIGQAWRRGGVSGLVGLLPDALRGAGETVLGMLGVAKDSTPAGGASAASAPASQPAAAVGVDGLGKALVFAKEVLDFVFGVLLDFAVMTVGVFCMLSQGELLVQWIGRALPLPKSHSARLVGEAQDVTRAIFVATVATAGLQTVGAAIGYVIAGIPALPVALLATFCAALIPVVGGATIVVAVGRADDRRG